MLKCQLDFGLAVIGIIVLSIPLLILAILIKIFLGSPILFKQQRPGLHGKPFTIYKFRTMEFQKNKTDEERLTKFGKFLRKFSLDELPELFNVLKGDMSIVGPRPLLVEYLPLYSKEQARRHDVKPGITGWAQINGRNAIGWDEKFKLDIWYVDNCSLLLDLKIIFITMIKVIKKDGINTKDDKIMSKFTGNKNDASKI